MSSEKECIEQHSEPTYITCPFCGGEDYDLIGLKIHFQNGWCDEFNDLETKSRLLWIKREIRY